MTLVELVFSISENSRFHNVSHSELLLFLTPTMAGILQNVFSQGIYTLKDPENVSKLKQLVNHSTLYVGLIVYTAIGAWVLFKHCNYQYLCLYWFCQIFQLLELPSELDRLETNQALLVTKRALFIKTVINETHRVQDDYNEVQYLCVVVLLSLYYRLFRQPCLN